MEYLSPNLGATSIHTDVPSVTIAAPPLPPVAFGAPPYYNYPGSNYLDISPLNLQTMDLTDPTIHSVVSSDFLSGDSPSSSQSISEPSSQTTATVTTCPHCLDKTFDGAPQNQRRNWRRHMFSEHGVNPRLECPLQGCRVTFKAGRLDNLKRHMKQKSHEGPLLSTVSTARKRKAGEITSELLEEHQNR